MANDFALRTIEEHLNKPKPLLNWIWPLVDQTRTQNLVTETFTKTMSRVLEHINTLVTEAEAPLRALDSLGVSLALLQEPLMEEDGHLIEKKSQILAELWTMLGGNKHKLQTLDHHFDLLKNVDENRQQARHHVVSTLYTLYKMRDDIVDLRTRVASSSSEDLISVEVQIQSIGEGMRRLINMRDRASVSESVTVLPVKVLGVKSDD